MSLHRVWVGHCLTRSLTSLAADSSASDDTPPQLFDCHAAARADSQAEFVAAVKQRLEREGHALIHTDEVRPVIAWLERHGYHSVVESLAQQIDARHPIALGPLTPLEDGEARPIAHDPKACEPWIGHCFFRRWEAKPANASAFIEPNFKDYACHAAVWTDHLDGFIATVKRHLEIEGYAFTWAEEVLPAISWMNRHGYHTVVERLAPNVNASHPLELGPFTRTGADGQPLPEVAPVLITRHDMEALPDQSDLPFWERDWIAPALKALLFAPLDDSATPLNTYFLVDATLRKRLVGIFDLDTVDVPVKCLFEGAASEAQKASAPYLADLTLAEDAVDDVDRVPRFHKSLFERHWSEEIGIAIRTDASFETVWRHCQRHLHVAMEGEEQRVFLRYWHPETLDALLPALEKGDARHLLGEHHLIYPRKSDVVHARLNPELEDDAHAEDRPFTLKPAYIDIWKHRHRERFFHTLCQDVARLETSMGRNEINEHVAGCLAHCHSIDLTQQDSVRGYVLLMALYRDPEELTRERCIIDDATRPEMTRKSMIHKLLSSHQGAPST